MIHFDMSQANDIVLMQLQRAIREQMRRLESDMAEVTAEILRRRGVNQMTMPIED